MHSTFWIPIIDALYQWFEPSLPDKCRAPAYTCLCSSQAPCTDHPHCVWDIQTPWTNVRSLTISTRILGEKGHILKRCLAEGRFKFRLVVAGTIIFLHVCTKHKRALFYDWISYALLHKWARKNKQKKPNKISYLKPELRGIISSPNFALFANNLAINFFLDSMYKAIPKGWSQLPVLSNCRNAGTFFQLWHWPSILFHEIFFYSSVS